ncbi:hypothetical protein CF335_g9160 [Tilletia laevis]|nr:hypothetical protein CF335_g9160 [Tilletia laevis]
MLAKDTSKGFTKEMIEKVYEIKTARKELSTLGDEGGALVFHGDGARPWDLVDKYDIALPCATQNEMNAKEAEEAVSKGCRYVAEGSNMGLEQSAIDVLEKTRMAKGKNVPVRRRTAVVLPCLVWRWLRTVHQPPKSQGELQQVFQS